jgi:hypothetical protein
MPVAHNRCCIWTAVTCAHVNAHTKWISRLTRTPRYRRGSEGALTICVCHITTSIPVDLHRRPVERAEGRHADGYAHQEHTEADRYNPAGGEVAPVDQHTAGNAGARNVRSPTSRRKGVSMRARSWSTAITPNSRGIRRLAWAWTIACQRIAPSIRTGAVRECTGYLRLHSRHMTRQCRGHTRSSAGAAYKRAQATSLLRRRGCKKV